MCFSLIFSFLTLPAILFVLKKIILYKKKLILYIQLLHGRFIVVHINILRLIYKKTENNDHTMYK